MSKRVETIKLTSGGVEVDAKVCTKCGEVKVLGDFGVDKRSSNGRRGHCLACGREYSADKRKRLKLSEEKRRPSRWTTEALRGYVSDITDGDYTCVSEYHNFRTHVVMRHNTCGQEWIVMPGSFLTNGTRCPRCRKSEQGVNQRKTHIEFIREMRSLVGDEYEVMGKYRTAHTHVLVRHSSCGHEWQVTPSNFVKVGTRCPVCTSSRGEMRIAAYLRENGYVFTCGYRFDDCRNKLPLPFDIAMKVAERTILLEYDGEQHFRPVNFAGRSGEWAERQFRHIQRKDRIKTEYCRANGIPLIRIDYTQFDEIEAILDRELSALGVTGKRNNTDNNDITRKEDAA